MIISNANKIYIGSQEASKIYIGSNLVFSSLWSPDQLGSSLVLWLDANDSNTIILNGSSVSQWNDKSGKALHFSQTTASKQPLFEADQFNGKASVKFDGISQNLSRTNSGLTASNWSFFAVIDRLPFNQFANQYLFDAKTGRFVLAPRGGPSYNSPAYYSPSIWAGGNSNTDTTGKQILEWILVPNNGAVYRNASLVASALPYTATALNGITSICSLNDGTTYFLNVRISEFILCNTNVLDADRQKIEGYLAWKWGLVENLPTNHPYKNGAP